MLSRVSDRTFDAAIGLLSLLALALIVYYTQRDPSLSPDVAATKLRVLVHSRSDFVCRPVENDESIQLEDVDYYCENAVTGFWIGTDGEKITELVPSV